MKPVLNPLLNVLKKIHSQADSHGKAQVEQILLNLKKSLNSAENNQFPELGEKTDPTEQITTHEIRFKSTPGATGGPL